MPYALCLTPYALCLTCDLLAGVACRLQEAVGSEDYRKLRLLVSMPAVSKACPLGSEDYRKLRLLVSMPAVSKACQLGSEDYRKLRLLQPPNELIKTERTID
jgi:hypothetical protein